MRRNILIFLAVTSFFSGCAYKGVVVEKRFHPVPFPCSLGLDAMYNFQLRDGTTGQTNSQMVTPDVFASYRVGDYFNDLQAAPAHDDKELEGFRPLPREMQEGPYQPVRVMQIQPTQRTATKVALHTPASAESDVKILRWQTVRIAPIQTPKQVVAKIALQAPDHANGDVKILRWQTVRIVPIQSPEIAAAKIAVHAPDRATGDVKILRWRTVRMVPIQTPEKVAVKSAVPAHPGAKSVIKTAASHNRVNHSTKVVQNKNKRAKVVVTHHRKRIASVN